MTLHDLYATYPGYGIDVAAEQALLLPHDRIVLQYPATSSTATPQGPSSLGCSSDTPRIR